MLRSLLGNGKSRKMAVIGMLPVIMIAALVISFLPSGAVTIDTDCLVSIETRVALAAQVGGEFGNGEPVPQQIVEATFSRGGPPVISIAFDDPASLDDDALYIDFSQYIPDAHVPKRDFVEQKPGEREAEREAEAEGRCRDKVNQSLEVWILLSEVCSPYPEDSVCQDPPVLLDNERVEKVKGKWYLVTTIAYFDVHVFSFDPLKFTVKINGLDAGPVTGEWWQ